MKIHQRHSIRLKGFDYTSPGQYFITLVTNKRSEVFGAIHNGTMRLNNIGLLAENEWQRMAVRFPHIQLGEYVVMPNHLHGIICIVRARQEEDTTSERLHFASPKNHHSARARQEEGSMSGSTPFASPLPGSLGAIVGAYKSTTARLINGIQRTQGKPVWLRNYYEHIIRNEAELRKIERYIQNNPIKWEQDHEKPS